MTHTKYVLSALSLALLSGCGGSDNPSTNVAPTLAQISDKTVESGNNIRFQLTVSDPDDANNGSDLMYELIEGPEGMTISATGEVNYVSTVTETTVSQVTIKVLDGGEDGAQPSIQSFTLSEPYFLSVSGNSYNYYTNEVLESIQATITNGLDVIAEGETSADGSFNLKVQDIDVADRMVLTLNGMGFGEASMTLNQSDFNNEQAFYIPPVHLTQTFPADSEIALNVAGTTLVSVPANAFVDGSGSLVTGEITAELVVINPQSDIDLMPGDMVTSDAEDNLVPIESFGAMTAEFFDENGNRVQLADGQQAAINIPAVGINPPATIPLYYYDTTQGIWIEEGEAALVTINDDSFYQGVVNQFATWNADKVYDTVLVKGCIEDAQNQPVSGIRVRGEGQDYSGSAHARTNAEGRFALPVKSYATTLITASFGDLSRTVSETVMDQDIVLEGCFKLSESFTRIQLNWGESPSDLDSWFTGPNANGGSFYVNFITSQAIVGDDVIWLDVDDTSSYGPEVISVPNFSSPGTYRYVVHRYSDLGEILRDETRVELSMGAQRTLFMPHIDSELAYWHVFDINVSESSSIEVVEVNQFLESFPHLNNENIERSAISYGSRLARFLNSKYYAQSPLVVK